MAIRRGRTLASWAIFRRRRFFRTLDFQLLQACEEDFLNEHKQNVQRRYHPEAGVRFPGFSG
jgi:hypothetical protein